MPKRYSPEIRRTALEFVNQGQTQIEVAQALGVNPKTLSHWVTTAQARMPEQQRNELEELKRKLPIPGKKSFPGSKTAAHAAVLLPG